MSNNKGIVAYCDGGANPNPNGPSGSGIHAYVYRELTEKEKPTRCESWIATDRGYMLKKDFDAGLHKGVMVEQIIEITDAIGLKTNNIGEVNAVSCLLREALTMPDIARVHIICDSEYTLKGMNEWVPGWKRNNWRKSDGMPPANLELWKELDALKAKADESFELTSAWVRGHNNDFGNEKADFLASIGVHRSWKGQLGQEVRKFDPADYYSKQEGIHPFISLKRVFFNTNPEFHQPGIYYQTDGSGKDFVTGKRSSEAAYSVVCVNKPDTVIENAIKATMERKAEFNRVVYGKIDLLKRQDILLFTKNWGVDAFISDRRNMNMNFLSKEPAVVEVRADELPLRAFDAMALLEEILVEFQSTFLVTGKFFETDVRGFKLFDVTDHFYETKLKKSGKSEVEVHELKKDFGVGCVNSRVKLPYNDAKAEEIEIILSFGEDVPPRNSFKHFELLNPIVYVVTWKDSDHLVRYGTVIKTDDAVGIWSNYFANNFLLR